MSEGSTRSLPGAVVRVARMPDETVLVRTLFEEYAATLDIDLCFQGFAAELLELPGRYAPPHGGLWLATIDDEPVGCVALRPLATGRCEIKRLYLRATGRGRGLGRRLVETALARAVEGGHDVVCLDTLPSMHAAMALYRSLGFVEVDADDDNPMPGALFLERRLR